MRQSETKIGQALEMMDWLRERFGYNKGRIDTIDELKIWLETVSVDSKWVRAKLEKMEIRMGHAGVKK